MASLFVSLVIFSGIASAVPTVVHGTPVSPKQPINAAIVRVWNESEENCTGTLISAHVVLTAGHCVRSGFGVSGRTIESLVRPRDNCSKAMSLDAATVPGAEPHGVFLFPDVALIHLDEALCGTVPAELAPSSPKEGDLVSAAGFGIGADDANIPNHLSGRVNLQTKAALLGQDEGENSDWKSFAAATFDTYSPWMRFARPATEYGSVCNGDSGGPVFSEANGVATLWGENAAYLKHPTKGIPACDNAYVQVFTPVAPNLAWIRAQVKSWEN